MLAQLSMGLTFRHYCHLVLSYSRRHSDDVSDCSRLFLCKVSTLDVSAMPLLGITSDYSHFMLSQT